MTPGWGPCPPRSTNVAETGKPESDEPRGRPVVSRCGADGCARSGRGPAEAAAHATPHHADRPSRDDGYLEEHPVAARDRTAAAHPGAAPSAVAGLPGATGRPRRSARGRRPADPAQTW